MEIKIIGGKIAKARKEKNIAQAELARLLFISPQAVGKWERGESMPDITTFNRLAEILGVDLNYFSESFEPMDNGHVVKAGFQSTGDKGQVAPEEPGQAPATERQVRINLNGVNLQESDFAGVVLHKGKFKASPLRGANFAGADLKGSSFEAVDARDANFDEADLTDCNFSVTDLSNARFRKSVLVRTVFNMSGQGAKFTEAAFTDVTLTKTDLKEAIFERCTFSGVDFNYCDLRGMQFGGQTFIGIRFNKSGLKDASFSSATLRNVSFTPPFSVTNKAYMAMKTICFDGAMMDKLTYAALKSLGVIDLSKVIII